ncbi:MAG: hypothetical protein KKC85_17045 [Gammaproteobacteria bacterium]|nr:hypothetical protein [Gammaproteobacteria bacterium]MBU1443993.1 hypothetical protein [Gammaproteobacteria bacterium]MBU2288122.1 hypothetical protein [Gammaproteobacteria bacterium]
MLQNNERGQPTTLRHFLFDESDPECAKEFDRFINVMLVVFILCLIGAICWHAIALGRMVDASSDLPHSTYFPETGTGTPPGDKPGVTGPAANKGEQIETAAPEKGQSQSKTGRQHRNG